MKTLCLDLDSAIIESAIQNLEYDIWVDSDNTPVNHTDCDIYLEEAQYLLVNHGENYKPSEEYNSSNPNSPHFHITAKKKELVSTGP